jgi:hypothetical protein
VPVTAKFSKAFYERLGEQVANELVELLNLIDATYRSELRDVNEMNFARFDAKLEQRVTQVEARIDQRVTHLESRIDQRVAQLDAKIDRVALELRSEMAALGAALTRDLSAEMNRRFEAQTRLILLSWVTLIGAIVGVGLR